MSKRRRHTSISMFSNQEAAKILQNQSVKMRKIGEKSWKLIVIVVLTSFQSAALMEGHMVCASGDDEQIYFGHLTPGSDHVFCMKSFCIQK